MTTMTTNNPLIAQFAGQPALVEPAFQERFEACLTAVVRHEHATELLTARADSGEGFWLPATDWRASLRPYVVVDGILQIPVKGVLLNDFPWALGGWATGYDYIWRAFERGMNDGNVRGIALVCDTPGGMVAGNFDLVDKMYAMRGTKPVAGFAHESAYSAGYSIISAADPGSVYVSRTGGVGSIGVVTSHADLSGMYERLGVKITFIFAGKHKVDGNQTKPLPDDVKSRINARIEELYGVFVSTVARNRGIDEKVIRATEALTFTATEATANGLADQIGSFDDSIIAFSAAVENFYESEDNEDMTTPTTFDQAAMDSATATARSEGVTQGRTDERARISAIMGSDEAKGRTAQANHIAFKTDMSVDDAKGMLGASAQVTTAPAAPEKQEQQPQGQQQTGFAGAMDNTQNPNLTAGNGGGDEKDEDADMKSTLALIGGAGVARFSQPSK